VNNLKATLKIRGMKSRNLMYDNYSILKKEFIILTLLIFCYYILGINKKMYGGNMLDKVKVQEVLDKVRPSLQADGGDCELINITEDNVVEVRLQGACGSCPMATLTLKAGIERVLKEEIPEVKEVISV